VGRSPRLNGDRNLALALGKDGAVETERSRWEPEDDDEYEAASAELEGRFTRWAMPGGVFDPDLPAGLLHYKWAYVDHHLTRWRRRDLSEIYLELYPAKVMAEADELDAILAETKTFITFLAETEMLDEGSESPDLLCAYLDEIGPEFRAHMADSSRYSFGKRLWTEAASEGVSPADPAAVEAFMDRFNARPRAERDAVFGRGVVPTGRRAATGRFTPPGTPSRSSGKRRKRRH
jgi:hypothetical protein